DRLSGKRIRQAVSRINQSFQPYLPPGLFHQKFAGILILPLHLTPECPHRLHQFIADNGKQKKKTSCTNILPEKAKNTAQQKSAPVKHKKSFHKLPHAVY